MIDFDKDEHVPVDSDDSEHWAGESYIALQHVKDLIKVATSLCGTPEATVCLVGEGNTILHARSAHTNYRIPYKESICYHTLLEPSGYFEVEDARKDLRFSSLAVVKGAPHIVFYAGYGVRTRDGELQGTLCVLDHEPRKLDEGTKASLIALGRQLEQLLETKRQAQLLEQARQRVLHKNEELEEFAYSVAHDLKSPLGQISTLSLLLKHHNEGKLDNPENSLK